MKNEKGLLIDVSLNFTVKRTVYLPKVEGDERSEVGRSDARVVGGDGEDCKRMSEEHGKGDRHLLRERGVVWKLLRR